MELTGIEIRNREIRESLEKEIRYFEEIRIKEDIRNTTKLKPLYEIYFRLREGETYE